MSNREWDLISYNQSKQVNDRVALTRDYKETVQKRLNNDPEFARALLHEAVELMLGGDAETARLILRDLVNATLGLSDWQFRIKYLAQKLSETRV